MAGGRLSAHLRSHRGRLLLAGSLFEFICVTVGVLILALSQSHLPAGVQDATAGAQREPRRSRDCETHEDDIASHVGHKDAAQT
jgi:hypothetical protein